MKWLVDAITVNNVFIREWLNGGLIPLNLSMLAIITYTVWRQTKFSWGWTKYPGANSACALWWIFFADFLRSVLAWSLLRETPITSNTPDASLPAVVIYMCAGVIALLATLRCIWCLTPVKARHATWISALLFTILWIVAANLGLFDWISDFAIIAIK